MRNVRNHFLKSFLNYSHQPCLLCVLGGEAVKRHVRVHVGFRRDGMHFNFIVYCTTTHNITLH